MAKKASPADAALERVRAICYGFAGTEEKLSHGAPAFFAGGRMFLSFVDDHHADGRLAVWLKSTHDEQRRLVASDPDRFFVPPYVGVNGWLGVRLDRPTSDWIELAILVEAGWAAVVPKKVAAGPVRRPPPPPKRPTTDGELARAALARTIAICEKLPESVCEVEGRHATFRVAKKVYAYFLDNHHGDARVGVCVKTGKKDNRALVASDAKRFFMPAYVGPRGYVGVRVDAARVDWKDVAARLEASYRLTAPKRLVKAMG